MKSKVRKRKGNNEEKNEVKGSKSKVRLPSWAHERSKRALVELEKKQFVRPKMALNEPMEDIKLIDEADDVIFNTEVDNSKNTINLPEIMLGPKLNRIKAPEALCKHKIFHVPIMKENVNLSSVKLNYIILEGRAGYDLDGMDLNTLANSAALKERKVWNEKIKQEYRMTVFNDMFQTIDVLIEKFNLLLEAKPYGKILIINCYPIECSSKTVASSKQLGEYAKDLIADLMARKIWIPQPKRGPGSMPHYLMAFGTGVPIAYQVLEFREEYDALDTWYQSISIAIMVNSFNSLNCGGLKKKLKQMYKVLQSNSHVEHTEYLISLLFTNEFILKSSKRMIQGRFHALRQDLLNKEGIAWLKWIIRGILQSPSSDKAMTSLCLPHLLVHGTENELVLPRHTESVIGLLPSLEVLDSMDSFEARMLENEKFPNELGDNCQPLTVSWLEAGHSILEERTGYFTTLVQNMIANFYDRQDQVEDFKKAKIQQEEELALQQAEEERIRQEALAVESRQLNRPLIRMTSNVQDVEDFGENDDHLETSTEDEFCDRLLTLHEQEGVDGIQKALIARNVQNIHGSTEVLLKRLNDLLLEEIKAENKAEKVKRARDEYFQKCELDRKQQCEEEKKVRNLEAEEEKEEMRQDTLLRVQLVREQQRQQLEASDETQARIDMLGEDKRSVLAQEWLDEQKQWTTSAKLRNKELQQLEQERTEIEEADVKFKATLKDIKVKEERRVEMLQYEKSVDVTSSLTLRGGPDGNSYFPAAITVQDVREFLSTTTDIHANQANLRPPNAIAHTEQTNSENDNDTQKENVADVSSDAKSKTRRTKKELKGDLCGFLKGENVLLESAFTEEQWQEVNVCKLIVGKDRLVSDILETRKVKKHLLRQLNASNQKLQGYEQQFESSTTRKERNSKALELAESEKMIIRVEVGTIRKMPITTEQLALLHNEASKLHTERNELLSNLSCTKEEIRLVNDNIQRMSLVQRPIETTHASTYLATIKAFMMAASDTINSVKLEIERIESSRSETQKKLVVATARIAKLQPELVRISKLKDRLIDTDVWIEGSMQRVNRKTLKSNLRKELDRLEKQVSDWNTQVESLDNEFDSVIKVSQFKIKLIDSLVNAESEMKQLYLRITSTNVSKELEMELASAETEAAARRKQQEDMAKKAMPLRVQVLKKRSVERTIEEKNWTALDIKLNPADYESIINTREWDEMQFDSMYQMDISVEDIRRTMKLPSRIQLALPFLRNALEVKVHKLLRKYHFEDGEEFFRKQDEDYRMASENQTQSSKTVLLSSIKELKMEHSNMIVYLNEQRSDSILERRGHVLKARASRTYDFQLPESPVLTINVSIVFQGSFGLRGYKTGKMAAMLYYLPPDPEDPSSHGTPAAIGYSTYANDVQLCSTESFGRIVIHHSPKAIPLASKGMYQVIVGSAVETNFSITITAYLATPVLEVLKVAKSTVRSARKELPTCKANIANLLMSMRLSERKYRLVCQMKKEANKIAIENENALRELTMQLEDDDIDLILASSQRLELSRKIQAAEKKFAKICKVMGSRNEEEISIKQGLERMAFEHRKLQQQQRSLEKKMNYFQSHLPNACGIMEDDYEGYRLADELNGVYTPPSGQANYWAKLSSLRAKLPSMLTPAQRLRRKYAQVKSKDLTTAERQWLVLDLTINADKYPSSNTNNKTQGRRRSTVARRRSIARNSSMIKQLNYEMEQGNEDIVQGFRADGIKFRLTKDEERLAAFSAREIDRIMHAPWNSLGAKEIQVRKILGTYSDEVAKTKSRMAKFVKEEEQRLKDKINRAKTEKFQRINYDAPKDTVETDVDAKCRSILQEIDRAVANCNDTMDSTILHSNVQRFPTQVLRLELEKELDRLLMEQVRERERNPIAEESIDQLEHKVYNGSDNDDESDSDEEARIARREAKRTKSKNAKLTHNEQHQKLQMVKNNQNMEFRQVQVLELELGPGGCVACKANPCSWNPYMDELVVKERMSVLHNELERIKRSTEGIIESKVCLSSLRSGNKDKKMRREDIYQEVLNEIKSWERHLLLDKVDSELHACHITKELQFETTALHGFTQSQQTKKVKIALEREHNRLVSVITCHEVVEDVLEGMLEGWVFGERVSERKALGFVPSIKRSGPISFYDLRLMDKAKDVNEIQKQRDDEHMKTRIIAQKGQSSEEYVPLSVEDVEKPTNERAIKKGSRQEHELNETENALRFGLFCMTFMYFRGLSLLKRQQDMWSVDERVAPSDGKGSAVERMRVKHRDEKRQEREKQKAKYDPVIEKVRSRKAVRYEEEVTRLRQNLWKETRKYNQEKKSILLIQKSYRGYVGRKAAYRWKIRRAEIDSNTAFYEVAANTLQRVYRGRLGRSKAEQRRLEVAEYIAEIRAQEALEEEEEYWRTHKLAKMKNRLSAFVDGKKRKQDI